MIGSSELTSIISTVFACVTGIAGMVISILLYKLNKRQQKEAWMKVYKEIHEAFWNDPVMAKVRYWINYDRAYQELKPILIKRREIDEQKCPPEELLEAEYKCIDDLDKFYNLAQRVAAITSQLKPNYEQRLWKGFYTDYWVNGCLKDGREDLKWYVEKFYPELLKPELFERTVNSLKKTGSHLKQIEKPPNLASVEATTTSQNSISLQK